METINNVASAASKAIWGDSTTNTTQSPEPGREPVSGETGDTSRGEPYDAGNLGDNTGTDDTKSDTRSGIPERSSYTNTNPSSTDPTSTTGLSSPYIPGNTTSTGVLRPEHDTDKTGVTSAHHPSSGFSANKPTSSDDTSGPGPTPSVGADVNSAQKNTPKHQGADRPNDEPSSDEHTRIQEAKKEAEDAQKIDTSGPGPRPLTETGGPAHKPGSTSKAGDDDDGPQRESHGEGTGVKYVKSTGLKADGGDFDAANPGAGKEADRLLETKDVHRATEPPKADETKPDPADNKTSKSKPSLGEKIKAKLHRS